MSVLWLLALFFFLPFVLFLGMSMFCVFVPTTVVHSFTVYLVLSSCLGDNVRTRVSRSSVDARRGVYDRNYLRTMTNSGTSMSEQIELQEIMDKVQEEVDGY